MLAIIPARGGSKGLPGKNIKSLHGKPMIAYTIEAALKAKDINRVIVSTDDQNIANVAIQHGAEVPFLRPSELAADSSKSIDVYKYTLKRIEQYEGLDVPSFIVLQPTSPLRDAQHIEEAIELFHAKDADSVISYCKEEHPIFWHKFITPDGKFEEIFDGDYIKNRQEIRPTYYPNGAIYIFKKDLIFDGNYQSSNSYAYIMGRKVSTDVDTINDFEYVKYLMKHQ